MIALYALFAIGLFFIVAGGLATYFFLQSERGQQVMQAVQDGAEWLTVASQAPGTEALREAGCETAMVSSAEAAFEIFSTVIPEAEQEAEIRGKLEQAAGGQDLDDLLLVICTLPRLSVGDTRCDELARTYANAVDETPDSFYVLAIRAGDDGPSCQGVYAPDGTLLESPDF